MRKTFVFATLILTAAAVPSLADAPKAVPDFAGTWGRNAFNLETPASGPGQIGRAHV